MNNYWFKKEFVVLDTETTGLNPLWGDALVEIAGQRVRGTKKLAEFCSVINPGIPCQPDAAAVHGMSDDYICKYGRPISEVLPEFVEFCAGAILVGHNIIRFDLEFINNHLRQLGLKPLTNEVIDTLDLARKNLVLPDYHLGTLARHYKIDYNNAHRALRDVEITREIFYRLTGLKKSDSLF